MLTWQCSEFVPVSVLRNHIGGVLETMWDAVDGTWGSYFKVESACSIILTHTLIYKEDWSYNLLETPLMAGYKHNKVWKIIIENGYLAIPYWYETSLKFAVI